MPIGSGAENYRRQWERICAFAGEFGRDSAAITRAVHLYYCMAKDRHARGEIGSYFTGGAREHRRLVGGQRRRQPFHGAHITESGKLAIS